MKLSPALVALLAVALSTGVLAEETAPTLKQEIKALIQEDAKAAAKKAPAKNSVVPAPTPAPDAKPAEAVAASDKSSAPKRAENSPTEPPTTLPTVEVNRRKTTELDRELYEQELKIAREKKNTRVGELDGALNSSAVNPTILGGASAKIRAGVAQERVELMEFEKELTEAMARAKTKEEKAALKKQIDDIRTMRRTLDQPR